ncbi:MAG: hypothetical protein WBC09_10615, partial [Thermoanaerobaculia bacterium]
MNRVVVGVLALVLLCALPAAAGDLYGVTAFDIGREYGGFNEHPPGSLVLVDLAELGTPDDVPGYSFSPGGTTFVSDLFDGSGDPGDAWVQGLDFDSQGHLFAAAVECGVSFCDSGSSRLLQVDPATGEPTEIGFITWNGQHLNILDLAIQPETDILFGISEFDWDDPFICFACLFTIDTSTGEATLVEQLDLGDNGLPGGLAFAPDGTLYLTTTIPVGFDIRGPTDLFVLDPATGGIVSREDILREKQFIVSNILIGTTHLSGLVVAPDGTLLGTGGDFTGDTLVFARVWGTVKNPDGDEIPGETWVWQVMGDSGEAIGDLAFQPDLPTPCDADDDADIDRA